MREIFSFDGMERKVLVFFGALALLTVLGPFGTYEELSIWGRLVYWVAIMAGVGFFMHVIVTVALSTQLLGRAGQIIRVVIGSVFAGLPGAVVVIFVDMQFRAVPLTPSDLPLIWVQVALIGIAISLVEFVAWRSDSTIEETPIRTKFHGRLSPELGQIISLSMQDHYVEVTCTGGTEMILIRMSDAIAELEGLEGTQTHRSHWVTREAIRDVTKSGQKMSVLLSDGRSLPVSATYSEQVRAFANEQR